MTMNNIYLFRKEDLVQCWKSRVDGWKNAFIVKHFKWKIIDLKEKIRKNKN